MASKKHTRKTGADEQKNQSLFLPDLTDEIAPFIKKAQTGWFYPPFYPTSFIVKRPPDPAIKLIEKQKWGHGKVFLCLAITKRNKKIGGRNSDGSR
jgi:hypothetical protein